MVSARHFILQELHVLHIDFKFSLPVPVVRKSSISYLINYQNLATQVIQISWPPSYFPQHKHLITQSLVHHWNLSNIYIKLVSLKDNRDEESTRRNKYTVHSQWTFTISFDEMEHSLRGKIIQLHIWKTEHWDQYGCETCSKQTVTSSAPSPKLNLIDPDRTDKEELCILTV